jgi:cysteine desulfurase
MSLSGYFDYNATTPMCDGALQAFDRVLRNFGNPSSKYSIAKEARSCLAQARRLVAQLIGAEAEEIIFTSGGTESNNWAIKGALTAKPNFPGNPNPGHIVISEIEHSSVLEIAKYLERVFSFEVTRVKPNREGLITPQAVQACLRPNTALVAIMMVNNEVGSIQPIRQIAKILRPRAIHFHVDGVQGVGKVLVDVKDLEVDTLSFAAHKFYGPKGVGGLYIRPGVTIEPLIHGGGQEGGLRGGTESVALVAAMGAAAEETHRQLPELASLATEARELLRRLLTAWVPGVSFNGPNAEHLAPNTLSLCIEGVRAEALAALLDQKYGIQVSLGSACSNNKAAMLSHVLLAMGLSENTIKGTLRISIGQYTRKDDLFRFVDAIAEGVAQLQRIGGRQKHETAST